ncbi:MAG: serine/threonine protein kinase [Xenococcus sp. (in: cyanobacteria)]
MSHLPDFSISGYLPIKIMGQNHYGGRITYLAKVLRQDYKVVIKQFQFTKNSLSWSVLDILEKEIKILKQLNHPRIPKYIDSFATDDGFCLVQEYKDAPSLAEVRTFTPTQIKTITLSILEILVYLQQQIPPVIHRDIKPANILVDGENNAYLIDFGFSRIGGEDLSGSSVVKGTPGFMPPEQLRGRLTLASDLYSLGMTAICLLCGMDSSNIANYIDNDYQVNFRSLVSGISNQFITWLEKIVQPNPNNRYSNAQDALEALQIIEIIPSTFELKQAQLPDKNSNLTQKIFQWLTLKQTIIFLKI